MRANRLLSILILLQLRGRLTAPQLARELEVAERTIYRDIDALSGAGVPVYTELGRSGGIVLRDGYRTKLTGLTTAESQALPLASAAQAASDLGCGAAAASAQRKLLASLPPDSGAHALRIGARFHMDPVPWYHRAETIDFLPTLAAAVWRDQQLRIEYQSWQALLARNVDPLGLVLKGGLWYLVAAVDKKIRNYRVSSIRHLTHLPTSFARPAGFDLAKHWAQSAHEFEQRLTQRRAKIRITSAGQEILRAVNPMAAEVVARTQAPSSRRSWVDAEIPIEDVGYAARELLRFGTEVEVIAPAALRTAIAHEIAALRRRYGIRTKRPNKRCGPRTVRTGSNATRTRN